MRAQQENRFAKQNLCDIYRSVLQVKLSSNFFPSTRCSDEKVARLYEEIYVYLIIGIRSFTVTNAKELNLTGHVKNVSDGTVGSPRAIVGKAEKQIHIS